MRMFDTQYVHQKHKQYMTVMKQDNLELDIISSLDALLKLQQHQMIVTLSKMKWDIDEDTTSGANRSNLTRYDE